MTDRELLERIVALDTTSGKSNRALADLIAGYLDDLPSRTELHPSPDGTRVNLLARFGPETDDRDRGLTLSGHMDAVPAGEPGWSSDPFLLREREGLLYGRGTADMKGFLAIAMNAVRRAVDRGLGQPLALALTYDEELGCLGAGHLAADTPPLARSLPRKTLIGEPTSLRVVRMHKGHTKLRVIVPGTSAHSGYPHLGDNAIEKARHVLDELTRLRSELEQTRDESSELFEPVPWPPLNIATISGGSAINIVPDRCTIEIGVRPLPSSDTAELVERIEAAVRTGATDATVELINESPPMSSPADGELHRALCAINDQKESHAVSFATDAGWFQKLGFECVVWGPGAIEVAHKPDEFIPVDEMVTAADRLDTLIARFCGPEA